MVSHVFCRKWQLRALFLIYLTFWGHVESSRVSLQARKAKSQVRVVGGSGSKEVAFHQQYVDPVVTPVIATACFIWGVKTGLIVIPAVTMAHTAAGIGAAGIIVFIAVALGAGATISYGGFKLYDILTETPGFTNETLSKAIQHSVRINTLLLNDDPPDVGNDAAANLNASEVDFSKFVPDFQEGDLSGFVFLRPGSNSSQAAQSIDRLESIATTCGQSLKPMGLGDSESSSRSGAMFWKCAKPQNRPDGPRHRVLIKGGIRDGSVSPEWETFLKMAPNLGARFDDTSLPTLLNRIHFGFDGFGVHWLALEDLNVGAKARSLGDLSGVELDIDWDIFDEELSVFYDVKPLPSRAPQLSDLLLHVKRIRKETGVAVKDFKGWSDVRAALVGDLDLLKEENVIDESVAVQVVGPLDVNFEGSEPSEDLLRKFHSFLLEGTPRCAYHLQAHVPPEPGVYTLWFVCVSVFDYFLTLSTVKSLQNQLQNQRWNDYGGKMTGLFDCIGDDSMEECQQYGRVASGQWIKVFRDEFEKNDALRLATRRIENDYRCCCDFTKHKYFGPSTPCRWDRYGDTAGKFSGCPGLLWHVDPAKGGCSDVDPPAPPPEPACTADQACCCDMTAVQNNLEGVKVSGFRKSKLNTIFYKPGNASKEISRKTDFDEWQGFELGKPQTSSLIELRDDACIDWLMVSYSDLKEENPQSGTFHFSAGEWRGKELFRKTEENGCVKVYTAKCGAGGIEVRETCDEKEKISVRCLSGFFCMTSSRKTDIGQGEVVVLNDPRKGSVTLHSGRVSFSRVDANSGSRKIAGEELMWTSMDGNMAVYHCGGNWYMQEVSALTDTESCGGFAFTNHIDWTSPQAVWWESVNLWGWSEAFPSIRSDLSAADVLAPMGKCGCSSNNQCEGGLSEMEHASNRAAYCPKQA